MSDNTLNPKKNSNKPDDLLTSAEDMFINKNINKQNMTIGSRQLRRAMKSKKKGHFKGGHATKNTVHRADFLNWYNS
jgi:hypothetical protein